MCLSHPAIAGICYWIGYTLAYQLILWSAPETGPSFELDAPTIAKLAVMSFFWTTVSVGLGWLLFRFAKASDHSHCVSVYALLLLACFGSALFALAQEGRRQVLSKSGVDIFTRAKTRYVVTGVLIGFLTSTPFIFGPV